jgi:NADP-dependent 3-hydroxy acid dehydrogenase YdfG
MNQTVATAMHERTHQPLHDRIAVVTGASSGIGQATARRLAANGARVALLGRRTDRLDTAVADITDSGGVAIAVPADVTEPDALPAAAERIASELGNPNLVVSNAGVMLCSAIAEARTEDWQRMLDTNLGGLLATTRAFLPALLDAAHQGPADLIVISSMSAHETNPGNTIYQATKAAESKFAEGLRTEIGPQGVRVCRIEPGITNTELQSHVTDPNAKAAIDQMLEMIPPLAADDLADAISYISSRPKRVNVAALQIMSPHQP